MYAPDIDEHSADADAGNKHLHVTVHCSLFSAAVVHCLVEGSVLSPTPGVLGHEEDEERHRHCDDADSADCCISRKQNKLTDLDNETTKCDVAPLPTPMRFPIPES